MRYTPVHTYPSLYAIFILYLIMQREEGLERLLKEKIGGVLNYDDTSKRSNTNLSSMQRYLFEVQMMAKQLYPNNKTLKEILNRQDFSKGVTTTGTTSIADTEKIIDRVKEIALAVGIEFPKPYGSIRNRNLKFSTENSFRETTNVSSSDSSDSLSPRETAEKIEKAEVQKANLNNFSTFMLAILAGAFIALGGIYFTFATSQVMVTRPFTQVLGGIVFSMGLVFVVITGAQLFTGNNLGVMGLASKKIKVSKLVKNWIIVYIGNAIGAVATAGVLYMSNAWTNNGYQFGIRSLSVASHKVSLGFVEAFFLGILCNCLVCLAIWLAASGKKVSDKILAIIFPISAFVAIGFEHSVANMYFLSFAFMIKNDPMLLSAMKTAGTTISTSNLDYIGIFNNLLPVTLGNIVGGSIFVGLVYWLAYRRNNVKEDSG